MLVCACKKIIEYTQHDNDDIIIVLENVDIMRTGIGQE